MNELALLKVRSTGSNCAARRVRLLWVAVFAAVLTTAGCIDQTPPPAPPMANLGMQGAKRVYSDPLLQQLSDAGAGIDEDAFDIDKSRLCWISFCDATIDAAKAKILARFFAAAPPASPQAGKLRRPIFLKFERCRVSREAIAALDGARRLHYLWFIATRVDDTTFADIESLPDLRDLNVDESDIGDDGLRFLAASPLLEALAARHTRVGDATLARLENAMKSLYLPGTEVTDDGLRIVGRFSELRYLDVSNCDVTDAGAAHLSRLTHLIGLQLSGTKVTDAGVRHLRHLNLGALELKSTNTSNACLPYLARMRSLRHLSIGGTRITKAGVAAALPNLAALPNYPIGYLDTSPGPALVPANERVKSSKKANERK